MEYKNNYSIISLIVSHNPPDSIYKLISQLIKISYKIIIIDSSNIETYQKMINYFKNNNNIIFVHEIKDYGLGNALNSGIKIAKEFFFDFLLIMEDDSFFDVMNINNIISEFVKIYSSNDVLYLSDNSIKIHDKFINIKTYIGSNTGIIISFKLTKEIEFRSDLFMDQIDIDFQYNIKKFGGNIIITRDKIIGRLPIGRENKNNINTISIFRFYLLTRNTIRLFLEKKITIKSLIYIPAYLVKGLISGQSFHYLLIALFNGIIDGIKNNLGITKTLKFFRTDLK